ncbi:MAG: C4-type zinc ribbon domain-containing protein [Actinomycetota bacterium]
MEASQQQLLDLLELQKIDSSVDQLRARLGSLPEQAELEDLQQRYRALERETAEREAELDEVLGRQRKLEHEIDGCAQKIEYEQKRMNSGDISNVRELSGLSAEIESLQRRKSRFEDDDLEVMQERENLEDTITGMRSELEQLEQQIAAATQKRDEASGEVSKELDDQRETRGRWAPRLPVDLLEYYESLRSAKSGVGAAALHGATCMGCHMKLPAQEVDRVRKATGLVRCDECGRILVVVDRKQG